jgi:hypothetical protein
MPTQRENEQHEAVNELLMALRRVMTAPEAFERLGLRDFQEFFSHGRQQRSEQHRDEGAGAGRPRLVSRGRAPAAAGPARSQRATAGVRPGLDAPAARGSILS